MNGATLGDLIAQLEKYDIDQMEAERIVDSSALGDGVPMGGARIMSWQDWAPQWSYVSGYAAFQAAVEASFGPLNRRHAYPNAVRARGEICQRENCDAETAHAMTMTEASAVLNQKPDSRPCPFKVAFTFSTVQGDYIRTLVDLLVTKFGEQAIYDFRNLQHRLARPDAHQALSHDYRHNSLLVVLCHSREYRQSDWTAEEMRATIALWMDDPDRVFLLDMDGSEKLHPIKSTDVFFKAFEEPPTRVFEAIRKRLDDLERRDASTTTRQQGRA